MLAWACTVHKVQELSLSKIVVSFQLLKQKNFNYGQIYVALSRVTSLDGLYVLGYFSVKSIRADPRALNEYNRMRTERSFYDSESEDLNDSSLTISLLNTRSLNKHLIDIAHDERRLKNDVICLTEIQLSALSNHQSSLDLEDFKVIFNNREDKFQSIAVYSKSEIPIVSHTKLSRAFYITINKPTFDIRNIKLLVLYKKIFNWLQEFVLNNHIDIILGDFNINGFEKYDRLSNILSYFNQVVEVSTHISGSLLDHVYVHKEFSRTLFVDVFDVYFSDHDSVKLKFI